MEEASPEDYVVNVNDTVIDNLNATAANDTASIERWDGPIWSMMDNNIFYLVFVFDWSYLPGSRLPIHPALVSLMVIAGTALLMITGVILVICCVAPSQISSFCPCSRCCRRAPRTRPGHAPGDIEMSIVTKVYPGDRLAKTTEELNKAIEDMQASRMKPLDVPASPVEQWVEDTRGGLPPDYKSNINPDESTEPMSEPKSQTLPTPGKAQKIKEKRARRDLRRAANKYARLRGESMNWDDRSLQEEKEHFASLLAVILKRPDEEQPVTSEEETSSDASAVSVPIFTKKDMLEIFNEAHQS